jgi:hypothetical protein
MFVRGTQYSTYSKEVIEEMLKIGMSLRSTWLLKKAEQA